MIIHAQRGRIDDQRCSFEPTLSSPSTSKQTDATSALKPGGLTAFINLTLSEVAFVLILIVFSVS